MPIPVIHKRYAQLQTLPPQRPKPLRASQYQILPVSEQYTNDLMPDYNRSPHLLLKMSKVRQQSETTNLKTGNISDKCFFKCSLRTNRCIIPHFPPRFHFADKMLPVPLYAPDKTGPDPG